MMSREGESVTRRRVTPTTSTNGRIIATTNTDTTITAIIGMIPVDSNLTGIGWLQKDDLVGLFNYSDDVKEQLRNKSNELWSDPKFQAKHHEAMRKWGEELSDIERKRLSKGGKKNKGKPKPEGFGEKVSRGLKGKTSNVKGKKHSVESRIKISQ